MADYVTLPKDDKFLTVAECGLSLAEFEGGGLDGTQVVVAALMGWVGRTQQGGDITAVIRLEDFRKLLDFGNELLERNGLR